MRPVVSITSTPTALVAPATCGEIDEAAATVLPLKRTEKSEPRQRRGKV
jgi:hypothetical protein